MIVLSVTALCVSVPIRALGEGWRLTLQHQVTQQAPQGREQPLWPGVGGAASHALII